MSGISAIKTLDVSRELGYFKGMIPSTTDQKWTTLKTMTSEFMKRHEAQLLGILPSSPVAIQLATDFCNQEYCPASYSTGISNASYLWPRVADPRNKLFWPEHSAKIIGLVAQMLCKQRHSKLWNDQQKQQKAKLQQIQIDDNNDSSEEPIICNVINDTSSTRQTQTTNTSNGPDESSSTQPGNILKTKNSIFGIGEDCAKYLKDIAPPFRTMSQPCNSSNVSSPGWIKRFVDAEKARWPPYQRNFISQRMHLDNIYRKHSIRLPVRNIEFKRLVQDLIDSDPDGWKQLRWTEKRVFQQRLHNKLKSETKKCFDISLLCEEGKAKTAYFSSEWSKAVEQWQINGWYLKSSDSDRTTHNEEDSASLQESSDEVEFPVDPADSVTTTSSPARGRKRNATDAYIDLTDATHDEDRNTRRKTTEQNITPPKNGDRQMDFDVGSGNSEFDKGKRVERRQYHSNNLWDHAPTCPPGLVAPQLVPTAKSGLQFMPLSFSYDGLPSTLPDMGNGVHFTAETTTNFAESQHLEQIVEMPTAIRPFEDGGDLIYQQQSRGALASLFPDLRGNASLSDPALSDDTLYHSIYERRQPAPYNYRRRSVHPDINALQSNSLPPDRYLPHGLSATESLIMNSTMELHDTQANGRGLAFHDTSQSTSTIQSPNQDIDTVPLSILLTERQGSANPRSPRPEPAPPYISRASSQRPMSPATNLIQLNETSSERHSPYSEPAIQPQNLSGNLAESDQIADTQPHSTTITDATPAISSSFESPYITNTINDSNTASPPRSPHRDTTRPVIETSPFELRLQILRYIKGEFQRIKSFSIAKLPNGLKFGTCTTQEFFSWYRSTSDMPANMALKRLDCIFPEETNRAPWPMDIENDVEGDFAALKKEISEEIERMRENNPGVKSMHIEFTIPGWRESRAPPKITNQDYKFGL